MIAVIIARAVVYVVLVHHAAFAAVFIYPVHSYSFKTFFFALVSIRTWSLSACQYKALTVVIYLITYAANAAKKKAEVDNQFKYTVSQKTSHFVFRCNFNKYWPIFKILSLVGLYCVENLQ